MSHAQATRRGVVRGELVTHTDTDSFSGSGVNDLNLDSTYSFGWPAVEHTLAINILYARQSILATPARWIRQLAIPGSYDREAEWRMVTERP